MPNEDDDENFETVIRDGKPICVLRDGGRGRVSLMMRDADSLSPVQRAIMHDKMARAPITDVSGNEGLALQRPGFRISSPPAFTTDAAEAREQAYRDHEAFLNSAWQGERDGSGWHNPRSSGGNRPPTYALSAGEGPSCTVDGREGRVVREGVCLPIKNDSASIRDAIEQAHKEHQNYLETAWRNTL